MHPLPNPPPPKLGRGGVRFPAPLPGREVVGLPLPRSGGGLGRGRRAPLIRTVAALPSLLGLLAAVAVLLDWALPPDLSRLATVGTEIVDEACGLGYFFGLNAEMLHDNFFDPLGNFTHRFHPRIFL